MLFPELRTALKRFMPDSGEPITLGLKDAGGFDPVSVAWYARNYPQIHAILSGGSPSWSGESVTRDSALGHSVMWACFRVICESMGRVPAFIMLKNGSNKRNATEHPMYSAMHDEPNPEISAQGFREMLTGHCLLDGDGFAKIYRRSGTGTAMELQHLLPEQVSIDREKQGQKRLVYSILNEKGAKDGEYTLERGKPHDIFHMRGLSRDGIRGYSILNIGRQSIGTALAEERNVASFWAGGGRLPYVLELDKKFASDDDFKKFRADWNAVYSDPRNGPITEPWVKYKQIGQSMVDAQALESRQFTITKFCQLTGLSPHLVGDLSHATFSNIEQLFLEFKTLTLSQWASRWEQDFRRCVFTPDEKEKGYFLHHNIDALLRGDFVSRMAGYASALQNGYLNVDEVRDLEDRNPLPSGAGQSYRFQLNMQTTPGTGTPTVVEQRLLSQTTETTTPTAAIAAVKQSTNGNHLDSADDVMKELIFHE